MAAEETKNRNIECFLASRAYNNDQYNGDTGIIKEYDNSVFIGIIDGAGHGFGAYKVAKKCREYLDENYRKPLNTLLEGVHNHIRGSGEAVLCLGRLEIESGEMRVSGIGNMNARRLGSVNKRLLLREGIVGYTISSPRELTFHMERGDVMLLCSDGVKSRFEITDYPELLKHDAKTIACNIINMFGKAHDDAACIALKYINAEP